MADVIKLDSIDQYNRLYGMETLHPLVTVVDAAESGTLQVYGLTGQLCRTVRCEAGRNVVEAPREKGVYVLRYVSATGQVQSRKMM